MEFRSAKVNGTSVSSNVSLQLRTSPFTNIRFYAQVVAEKQKLKTSSRRICDSGGFLFEDECSTLLRNFRRISTGNDSGRTPPQKIILIRSGQKVLTGSAVAILQISVWKVSAHWTTLRMRNVTPPPPRTCAVCRLWLSASPRLHPSPADEGMASTEAGRECETEGCSKDAKLQCPTCIKLGIQGSYFCSQVPPRLVRFKGRLSRCIKGLVCQHEAANCQARWSCVCLIKR